MSEERRGGRGRCRGGAGWSGGGRREEARGGKSGCGCGTHLSVVLGVFEGGSAGEDPAALSVLRRILNNKSRMKNVRNIRNSGDEK